jgi:drug/metabolite transporter (DMT)-like permease
MESGHLIVLCIGLIGSATIHLSQGMLKLAIHRRSETGGSHATSVLYGTGLVLNFSAPLWVILANRFGPTVLYTSMYATGLLGLILFSCWKLNRPIRTAEILGVTLVIVGSIIVVLAYNRGGIGSMAATNPTWLLAAALLLALALLPGIRLAQRWIWLPPGLVMGGFGGAFLALDSLLKGVAQSEGGAGGFLPVTGTGWALFTFSFFGAAAALGMTQWAYAKQQPPTATIAAYDAAYVALPILILPLAQGQGARLDLICLSGLLIIVAGLAFVGQANRDNLMLLRQRTRNE